MAITTLNELINPKVMGDFVNDELKEKMLFSPLCVVDTTLQGRAGDTIVVPKYSYIGDAGEVAEGGEIPVATLLATAENVTVKKAGNGITLSDESLLSGYGDPAGEAARQLALSIAQKVDSDVLMELETIGENMTFDAGEAVIGADVIADALTLFGEMEGEKYLFVAPQQLAVLRKSEAWLKNTDVGADILVGGKNGSIHGCQLVVSGKVKETDGKYHNFIVMPGALTLFLKQDTTVEADRDIVKKTTVITADKHYAVQLTKEAKAVKMVCKA